MYAILIDPTNGELHRLEYEIDHLNNVVPTVSFAVYSLFLKLKNLGKVQAADKLETILIGRERCTPFLFRVHEFNSISLKKIKRDTDFREGEIVISKDTINKILNHNKKEEINVVTGKGL